MKWTRSELLRSENLNIDIDADVTLPQDAFSNTDLIDSAKDVHAVGTGFFDEEEDRFYVQLHIDGIMCVKDAISGTPLDISFATDIADTYVFAPISEDEEEDVRVVTDDVIDLTPSIVDAILLEAPLQVSEVDEADYPSGDGWQVMTEAEYLRQKQNQVDPRLAALRELMEEKD